MDRISLCKQVNIMILRDKPHALRLFFIIKGSVVPIVASKILFVTLLGTAVAWVEYYYSYLFPPLAVAPMAFFGVALSLFLGFRNNASYERWWEARKQWGKLIVESKSLTRQIISYIDFDKVGGETTKKRLVLLIVAYNHALRHYLRKTEPWNDIEALLGSSDVKILKGAENVPDTILLLIGMELSGCLQKDSISDFAIQNFDNHLTQLTSVQAACERIKNTPIPFAYMLLVQRTTYLYCFTAPFAIVASLGVFTPLFCAVIAYTFFGLDALSDELEEPFGTSANDLPLEALTRMTEINLRSMLGEVELPKPILPVQHILT